MEFDTSSDTPASSPFSVVQSVMYKSRYAWRIDLRSYVKRTGKSQGNILSFILYNYYLFLCVLFYVFTLI